MIKEQEKRSRRKSSHIQKKLTIFQRIKLLVSRKSKKQTSLDAAGLEDKLNECLEHFGKEKDNEEEKGLLKANQIEEENFDGKYKIDSCALTIEISEC